MTKDTTKCMVKALKKIEKDKDYIEVYYMEKIEDGVKKWWADILQNELNKRCNLNWTWTVISRAEIENDELTNEEDMSDWNIIVEKPFSEKVIKKSIEKWMAERGVNLNVKIVNPEELKKMTGYIRKLEKMDLDTDSEDLIPMDDLDFEKGEKKKNTKNLKLILIIIALAFISIIVSSFIFL